MQGITLSFAAHMTARVRGMKSTLLDSSELDGMIDRNDGDAMAQTLLSTPYDDEIAESLTRYTGADAVEDAVSRNLVLEFARLRHLSRGKYEALADIFIARWDLSAVKSLLRNLHHGQDAETAEGSLVPGPSLPVPLLKEFAKQNSMEALARGLAAWNTRLCRGLVEALPAYQDRGELRVLEEALDRTYFVGNLRRLKNERDDDSVFLQDLLRMEIDRINLRMLLSAHAPGKDPEEVLSGMLPLGYLSANLLRNMASATSADRAVEMLEGTRYAAFLESVPAGSGFAPLDRRFEMAFLYKLKRAAQQQGIGLAVLMYYAWLKYNEVMNLRMIARGVDIHLPAARIREELVHV